MPPILSDLQQAAVPRRHSLVSFLLFFLAFSLPASAAPPFSGTIFVNADIITAEDTSTFLALADAGEGTRNEFDRRVDDFVDFQAFLFQASYSDTANIEIQVNTEFGTRELARPEAERYARIIGQMPVVLKQDLNTVTIHQGDVPFGGGNNNLLIHVGSAGGYITDGILEETVVHELSHTSLDSHHAATSGWLSAQASDPEFISTYALDNPDREDVAESFLLWMALRYRSDRIPSSLVQTVESAIPARLAYFDAAGLNMSPIDGTVSTPDEPEEPEEPEEPGLDFSSATSVTPFTPAQGTLAAGATVLFRVDAPATATLTISTTSDLDTVGLLYDAQGNELLSDDDSGAGNQFQLVQTGAFGTFYVGVKGFNDSIAGDFTLNVGIEFDDTPDEQPTRPEAPIPAAPRINFTDGITRDVSIGIGAYTASGELTYSQEFVAGDSITILTEVMPDPDDVGTNGEIYVAVKSVIDGKPGFTFLNTDGVFENWNLTPAGLGAAVVATPLAELHTLTIFEGSLQPGKHNIYVAYMTDGGALVYSKALKLDVAE